MKSIVPLELCARRASELPHLQALAAEFRKLGIEPEVTVAGSWAGSAQAGLRIGPLASRVRVLVEDPQDGSAPADGASLVLLWAAERAAAALAPGAEEAVFRPVVRAAGQAVGVAPEPLAVPGAGPASVAVRPAAAPAPALPAVVQPTSGAPAAPVCELASIEAQIAFGDLESALAALEQCAQRDAGPAPQRMLAQVHRLKLDLPRAGESVARAEVAARLELGRVLCERARLEVEQGRFQEARQQFARASELAPDLADAIVGLGSLALHGGDAVEAERCFLRAQRIEKTARVSSGLGLSLCSQGRHRDALPVLGEALKQDPECQAALHGLVQAAFQTGELAAAKTALRSYVDRHPGSLGFAFSLAGISFACGDQEQARALVEQIAVFDPAYPGLAELREKLRRA